jgi:hypothetical protein
MRQDSVGSMPYGLAIAVATLLQIFNKNGGNFL